MNQPRRHHYMPAFLLRRFSLPGRPDGVRVIRSDRVFETGVSRVGVEKDFHEAEKMVNRPEELLSHEEGQFATWLRELRPGFLNAQHVIMADRLVAHLVTRSKIVRELARGAVHQTAASSVQAIADVVKASQPTASMHADMGAFADQAVALHSQGKWEPGARDDLVRTRGREVVRSHLIHRVLQMGGEAAAAVMGRVAVDEILRGVHTYLLTLLLLNHRSASVFRGFEWRLMEASEPPLLLGDVGPVVQYPSHGELSRFLPACPAEPEAVFLPVGSGQLLCGSRARKKLAVPDAGTLNLATVELSREFVVGVLAESEMKRLRSSLGRRCAGVTPLEALGFGPANGAPAVELVAREIADAVVRGLDSVWEQQPPVSSALSPVCTLPPSLGAESHACEGSGRGK